MYRTSRFSLVFIVVCAVLLISCASPTPIEKVAASRAEYKATLNSFFVKETPLVVEEPEMEGDESGESTDDSAEDSTAEPTEGEDAEPVEVPVRLDAVLDVIVQHDSRDPIDGITLDISLVDNQENEVKAWQYWIDTSGMQKANQRPYSVVFEDVPYEEGYGFFVEVRSPIAESERSQYREFEGL